MAKEGMGIGLASVSVGVIFIYGGIKGYSPLKAAQNIIQGKPGSSGQSSSLLTDTGGTNSPGTSPTASYGGSVAKLWISLGGDPAKASIAACIASHESGGNANATSSNPDGGTNVGLFQLDTPGGKGAGYTVEQLKDPVLNTRITIRATNNGRDWSAWSTAPMCGV
jgi:hypothetical protein